MILFWNICFLCAGIEGLNREEEPDDKDFIGGWWAKRAEFTETFHHQPGDGDRGGDGEVLVLENMVKSLGFSDAVVSVSSDSDNINVFINSSELTYDTALSIYNMLKNETGVVSGNIVIMPVYSESWKRIGK